MPSATAEPRRALPRDDVDDDDDDATDLSIDDLDDESWDLDESDVDDLEDEDWDDLEDDVEEEDDARLARAPRRRSSSSDASPPKSTAFVMLGVTVLVAAAVFLARRLRIRRRASRDAPRAPALAVDGAAPRKGKACAHCGATAPESPGAVKLLRCGRCKSAFFCSAECQRAAWKTHKAVCRPVEPTASAPRTAATAAATRPPPNASAAPDGVASDEDAAAAARKYAARDEMRRKIAAERASFAAASELQRRLRDAQASFWSGRYRESVLALQDIASEAHDVGPVARGIECEALRMAGHGLIRLRQFDAADRCLDACVGIARSMRHRGLEANALVAMGQLAATREPPDYDAAVAHHSRARDLARETDDVPAEAAACLNLANATVKRGDRVAGEAFTREALRLREDYSRTMAAAVERADAAVAAAAAAAAGGPGAGAETDPDPASIRARMAAASARRQLAEARCAEAAATATLGSTLAAADRRDRSAIAAEVVAKAKAEAAEDPESESNAAAGSDSASMSAGAGSAAEAVSHFHAALDILRLHADEVKDAEMEVGILINLANVNENQIGGEAGHAAAVDARRRLDDAASVVSGGSRRLSTTCAVCLEALVALEAVPARREDPGGDARRVTCLDCLHCYHSKCWESWTDAREIAGERATCPECKRSQTMV